MTTATEVDAPTVLICRARVHRVERLSPAFVRVHLAAPELADLGVEGYDTRFKLVLPGPTGELPELPSVPEDWYAGWLAMPDFERSPMRTYTIRDVVTEGGQTLLVVDLVVHDPGHGPVGPACRWALSAVVGDEVQIIGPHRRTPGYGGTEFAPGDLRELLLVGDETAVPAVSRILADLPAGFRGRVFLEVPGEQDILPLDIPDGFEVTWLARMGAGYGRSLVEEVRRFLGLAPLVDESLPEVPSDLDVEVWETPRHSSAGEDVEAQLHQRSLCSDLGGVYAWIAGESWSVKALRRSLVTELDVDRARVAFMGYWREGVAMKS